MNTSSRKKMQVGLLATASLLVLAGGLYAAWLFTPPALPSTNDDIMDLVGSPRFTRLSPAQKERYYDRMTELGDSMSADERRTMWQSAREDPEKRAEFRSAMEYRMYSQARRYAQAAPEEKMAVLDEAIQAMAAMMAQRPRGGRPGGERGGNRENDTRTDEQRDADRAARREARTQEIQNRIERGNPQRQALTREFFQALRKRGEELGLPTRGPGRGGPGPG